MARLFPEQDEPESHTRSISKKESSVGYVVEMGIRPNIRLLYTSTKPDGEKIESDYQILLLMTPCNYGGKRY